jgi:hypothetical protein
MKATDFEYRHQTLLHFTAISIAFLTYLVDRVDVVWALVQGQTDARLLERIAFAIATLLIGSGAALRTWAHVQLWSRGSDPRPGSRTDRQSRGAQYAPHIGSLLFAIGLGSLAPLPGFILLTVAETILASRLILREKAADSVTSSEPIVGASISSPWRNAIHLESGKCALFLTMLVFTSLLNDRITEILGVGCFLLAALLNYKSFCWSR